MEKLDPVSIVRISKGNLNMKTPEHVEVHFTEMLTIVSLPYIM